MLGLLLDLDGTLLDDHTAGAVAFRAFCHAHGRKESPHEALRWRTVGSKHWAHFERGELTFEAQQRERVREFLDAAFNDADADAAFAPYLRAYEAAWTMYADAEEFLVRTAKFKRVIVTNGQRNQQLQKIEATGLRKHVAEVVTPAECGCWKPNPRFFNFALHCLGLNSTECAMVGDDALRDIAPAAALGLRTFTVKREPPHNGLLDVLEAMF